MSFPNNTNANENIDNIQETTRDLDESDFESDNEEFEPVSLTNKFKNIIIEDVDAEGRNKRRNSNESQLLELNNCIPNDLLKQIESSSPVNSIRTFSEFELSNNNLPHVLLLPERRHEMLEQPKARELIYNLSPNNKKYNTTKSAFSTNFTNQCNQPIFINNCPNNFQQPPQQSCSMKYQPKHVQPQNFNSPRHTGHPFCINLNSPQKINSQNMRIPIIPTRSESAQVVSFQHLDFNNVLNNEIHNSNYFIPNNPGSGHNIHGMISNQNNQNQQSTPKLFTKTINNFSESGSGLKPKTVEPFNNVFTGKKGWSCSTCKNFNFESKFKLFIKFY